MMMMKGLQLFTFASPLRQGCRMWVSLEFLKGTWRALLLRALNTYSTRPHNLLLQHHQCVLLEAPLSEPRLQTCPSAVRDLLIAAASTSRWPSASVLEIRSEPARSHRLSVPRVVWPVTWSEPSTSSATSRWERELSRQET